MLDVEPQDMLHPSSFNKLGLDISNYNEEEALIGLLLAHPEVMNRPIAVCGSINSPVA